VNDVKKGENQAGGQALGQENHPKLRKKAGNRLPTAFLLSI
jgi:hypothetical protein